MPFHIQHVQVSVLIFIHSICHIIVSNLDLDLVQVTCIFVISISISIRKCEVILLKLPVVSLSGASLGKFMQKNIFQKLT